MRSPVVLVVSACALLATAATAGPRRSVRHELAVVIDPAAGTLEATDRIHLSAGGSVTFALARGLAVQRLAADGAPIAAEPNAGRWTVELHRRNGGEIAVEYGGRISDAGDERLSIAPAATLLAGPWYPVLDSDELSYDLTVEIPSGQIAVAPGRIVSEEADARRSRARFASEGPVDSIPIFAGPYRMAERQHGRIRVRTYLLPDLADRPDLAELYLRKVGEYLDLYEKRIGDYPYSCFHVVSGSLPLGLGFPGLTYMGVAVLRLPFIPDTSLGHEVLHSWWGNGVAVDASEGNWAEGLTTFMADYAYAERNGEDAARDARLRWLRDYAVLPADRDQPLAEFRSREHTASQVVGYHKAAFLFLMLRDRIGTAAFERGVRELWAANRFRSAGWSDVRRAFEKAAGKPLGRFFAEWLRRRGAPTVGVRAARAGAARSGFRLAVDLEQTAPAYELSVPLDIETEGETIQRAFAIDSVRSAISVDVERRPLAIRVDPEFRLFRRLAPEEVPPILRSVAFDLGASTAIAAADDDARAAAGAVASALFEAPPRIVAGDSPLPRGPLLLVGTSGEIAALAERYGLGKTPDRVAGKGTARAWAGRRPDNSPLLVVAADDAAALHAIAGPLPHYGSESFVVFDGRRAVEHGLWVEESRPVPVSFAMPNSARRRWSAGNTHGAH